ncbi:hypothetical protein ACWGPD_15380 [Streptomyces hirsutus]|uniref:hypothetical protein n=1 Tax=Streptomyces hirsutus TaxID=35620 RepID=UPI0036326185
MTACAAHSTALMASLYASAEEPTPPPRILTQQDHLVGHDTNAQEAVIVLLRALGKWAPARAQEAEDRS